MLFAARYIQCTFFPLDNKLSYNSKEILYYRCVRDILFHLFQYFFGNSHFITDSACRLAQRKTQDMKKQFLVGMTILLGITINGTAQKLRTADVPAAVRSALIKKYPNAAGVSWEKEKGNFEANWGGRSKEDNSVVFTREGIFVEMVVAIPISELPVGVTTYVKTHYPSAKITEAGKVTDALGKTSYEAEVKGKDLLFDEKGNFIKVD